MEMHVKLYLQSEVYKEAQLRISTVGLPIVLPPIR